MADQIIQKPGRNRLGKIDLIYPAGFICANRQALSIRTEGDGARRSCSNKGKRIKRPGLAAGRQPAQIPEDSGLVSAARHQGIPIRAEYGGIGYTSIACERSLHLAGLHIPDLDGLVLVGRSQPLAIRAEKEAIHEIGMSFQGMQQIAGAGIPYFGRITDPDRRQQAAIRAKGDDIPISGNSPLKAMGLVMVISGDGPISARLSPIFQILTAASPWPSKTAKRSPSGLKAATRQRE